MPNEVINCVHRMAHQEKANCSLVFQNQNCELLPDQDDEDDESYSPSVSDSEAEYELLDPIDNIDDQSETQGVDTPTSEPELEPTMIGDGPPLLAIHTESEQAVPEVMAHEDFIAQPTRPDTDNPITGSSQEGNADQCVEPEDTVTHPLAPIPPGTEQELCRLEINDEVPCLTHGRTRLQSWQLNLTTISDPPILIKQ